MSIVSKREELPLNEMNSQLDLIKRLYCKDATPDEIKIFSHVCQKTGLDPMRNQIYFVKRQDKMTIQTSIDGYRLIAERSGRYTPGREPTYTYNKDGGLLSATAYIKKRTNDKIWHEVSATAFYEEYVQKFKNRSTGQWEVSNFWIKMPHVMLAKCAESLALRRGFPAELSDIYTTDEMSQASVEEVNLGDTFEPKVQKVQLAIESVSTNVERLFERLELDGLNVERLDTFLQKRSEEINRPKEAIVNSALLNEEMTERFERVYLEWCNRN